MEKNYDVIIIGGGMIGSAVARELSRYQLKIGVLEKNLDVCYETSGRNSAVVHGGFAYEPGSLKAKLCVEGREMMDQLSKELDFPFLRCGKVLVGNTEEDMETLEQMMKQGEANGATGLEIIHEERLHQLIPAVVGKFAMFSSRSGILEPFHYTIALAENAHENGVDYHFDHEVIGISRDKTNHHKLLTKHGEFRCGWVVNAAGLGCGNISEMLGISGYRIIGSKGDYIVLDKRTGDLLPMPVYPVPSNTYMGIHVTNTIDGNVTVGPSAETVENFTYYGVPKENMNYLVESASKLWPHIHSADYIRNYSGILPKWVDETGRIQDFKIDVLDSLGAGIVNLIGIESPGLTAAIPIARYAINQMKKFQLLKENPTFNPNRKGILRFEKQSLEEKSRLIKENPDYGEVICRCETVTKAELLQAIHNPLGVHTMVGIKYRTRAMMGRCQGGYCQMRMEQMIEEELGKDAKDVLYARQGSFVIADQVRKENSFWKSEQ